MRTVDGATVRYPEDSRSTGVPYTQPGERDVPVDFRCRTNVISIIGLTSIFLHFSIIITMNI